MYNKQLVNIFYWLGFILVIIFADQFSKRLIIVFSPYAQSQSITKFLNITLNYNSGAAFGFLANAGGWQRWFLTLCVLCCIYYILCLLIQNSARCITCCFALSLILGGAIGNLMDRFLYGYVIDFIDFHLFEYHWPAFNLADATILIGSILFMLKRH